MIQFLFGLLSGFVLMRLAIGASIEAWKSRCLESEKRAENFKQSADERGQFISHMMGDCPECAECDAVDETDVWPEEILG